jgi:hypothetical protein
LKPLLLANIAFFGPLYGSIMFYRLFEHPLRHFDGPRLAAVSKVWHFAHMFTTPNHLFLDGIIKEYGDIVRTGTSFRRTGPSLYVAVDRRRQILAYMTAIQTKAGKRGAMYLHLASLLVSTVP